MNSHNWPAGVRAIARWFPPHRRGLAMAVFDSGAALGAACWLLDDEHSRFVTGITIPMDGGFLASSGV